jgi:hypothetical protein
VASEDPHKFVGAITLILPEYCHVFRPVTASASVVGCLSGKPAVQGSTFTVAAVFVCLCLSEELCDLVDYAVYCGLVLCSFRSGCQGSRNLRACLGRKGISFALIASCTSDGALCSCVGGLRPCKCIALYLCFLESLASPKSSESTIFGCFSCLDFIRKS